MTLNHQGPSVMPSDEGYTAAVLELKITRDGDVLCEERIPYALSSEGFNNTISVRFKPEDLIKNSYF